MTEAEKLRAVRLRLLGMHPTWCRYWATYDTDKNAEQMVEYFEDHVASSVLSNFVNPCRIQLRKEKP